MLAKSFVDTASAFEQFRVQLTTITGSLQQAKASMGWITNFAATTPYELDEVTQAFIKLKNYGIDPTDGTLRILGDTASAMGKRLDDAVEALADAMTGEFERLKEFGIKAGATADKVTLRFMKNGQMMAITVKNSAEEIKKALMEIFGDKFAGGMERMSKTFRGMLSNLADYWTQFKNEVMESGVFNYIKAALEVILEKIKKLKQTGKFDEWARKTGKAITSAFESAAKTLVKIPIYIEQAKLGFVEFFHFLSEHSRMISVLLESAGAALFMRGNFSVGARLFGAGVAIKNMGQYAEGLKQAVEKTKKTIAELKKGQGEVEKFFADVHKKFEEFQKAQETAAQSSQNFANTQKNVSNAVQSATNAISQQASTLKSFQDKLKSVMDTIRWQQMTPEERYVEVRSKLDDLFSKALNDDNVEAAKEYVDTFQKYMDLLSQFEGNENVLQEFENSLQDLQQWFGTGELSVNIDTSSLESANQVVSDIKGEIQGIKDLLPIEISATDKTTEVIRQIKSELRELKTIVEQLKNQGISITVDGDTSKLAEIAQKLEALSDKKINITAEGNIEEIISQLNELPEQKEIKLSVQSDISKALSDLEKTLQNLKDKQIKVEAKVKFSQLENLARKLSSLPEQKTVDISALVDGIGELKELLSLLSSLPNEKLISVSTDDKSSEVIKTIRTALQDLKDKQIKVEAKDETSRVLEKIKRKLDELKEITIDIKIRQHIETIYADIEKAIKRGQLDLSGGQVG